MKYLNQGKFTPRNPEKYKGNPGNIFYRSGWERKLMNFFDLHEEVKEWSSETTIVPYRDPSRGNRMHRYFPDFVITEIDKSGNRRTIMIEVKPLAQTKPPVRKSRVTQRYLTECATYARNEAKFEAARAYCARRGWEFRVLTEKEIL